MVLQASGRLGRCENHQDVAQNLVDFLEDLLAVFATGRRQLEPAVRFVGCYFEKLPMANWLKASRTIIQRKVLLTGP